jgi:hypothetical protein
VGPSFSTHLVKGSPYVTVVYTNATLRVCSEHMHIVSWEPRQSSVYTSASVSDGPDRDRGEQGIARLGNGQRWFVWASGRVGLHLRRSREGAHGEKNNVLEASRPFSGVLRVALIPPSATDASLQTQEAGAAGAGGGGMSNSFDVYMRYVRRYPTGGHVIYRDRRPFLSSLG